MVPLKNQSQPTTKSIGLEFRLNIPIGAGNFFGNKAMTSYVVRRWLGGGFGAWRWKRRVRCRREAFGAGQSWREIAAALS